MVRQTMEYIEFFAFHTHPHAEAPDGLFPVNAEPKLEGITLYTSDRKLSQSLKNACASVGHEYQITFKEPVSRALLDDLKAITVGVKSLSDTRLRVIAKRSLMQTFAELATLHANPIKHLKLYEIHGIRLRELGAGNLRKLTKKERNDLLRLVA